MVRYKGTPAENEICSTADFNNLAHAYKENERYYEDALMLNKANNDEITNFLCFCTLSGIKINIFFQSR